MLVRDFCFNYHRLRVFLFQVITVFYLLNQLFSIDVGVNFGKLFESILHALLRVDWNQFLFVHLFVEKIKASVSGILSLAGFLFAGHEFLNRIVKFDILHYFDKTYRMFWKIIHCFGILKIKKNFTCHFVYFISTFCFPHFLVTCLPIPLILLNFYQQLLLLPFYSIHLQSISLVFLSQPLDFYL